MDLEQIRGEIDRIDGELVGLLARREQWVRQAAKFKRDDAAVRAPDRVEQVVSRARGLAADAGGSPDVAEATYRAMIGAFIALELDAARKSREPNDR